MNKQTTVYAVVCPTWDTPVSLYETRELAELSAHVMNGELPTTHHKVEPLTVFGTTETSSADPNQMELDV
tara:strand:- start:1079 stop:1288 length:210 start_codon:yes stop_codon:yes gene_type:complete